MSRNLALLVAGAMLFILSLVMEEDGALSRMAAMDKTELQHNLETSANASDPSPVPRFAGTHSRPSEPILDYEPAEPDDDTMSVEPAVAKLVDDDGFEDTFQHGAPRPMQSSGFNPSLD